LLHFSFAEILEMNHYQKIAQLIRFLNANFKSQPDLEQMAEEVNLSPFHLQRLFKEWAGISPKKFVQILSVNYAKNLLRNNQLSLFDTAFETGLSGTGRLHDLFVNIEAMTPGEFKNEAENLLIDYCFSSNHFGDYIMASTAKGIAYLAFFEDKKLALQNLYNYFPKAKFREQENEFHQSIIHFFRFEKSSQEIKLHLKGTPFQLKVWEALLKIPSGKLSTYSEISEKIENKNAQRAVGSAIGSNPVAYLIPCHRVILSTGSFGNYMWGTERKKAILTWELAQHADQSI